MNRWFAAIGLAVVIGFPANAAAQVRDTGRGPGDARQRAEMEQRFRARLAQVVNERLGLTPDQSRRLQEVDRQFEPQRQALMRQEMQVRRSLRQQIAARDSADQTVTAGLLDRMLVLQRERTELAAREQRALAAFLTPVQRAQLIALQADLHRRVMNARRGDQRGGPRSPGEKQRRR